MQALVTEFSVSDIAASRRFYCEVLGFTVRHERPDEGFAHLALGSAELMLDQIGAGRDWITGPLERPLGRGVNFQIEVAAIEPIRARLDAAEIALFQPIETRTYRRTTDQVTQRQFCVQDPDGYLSRFCERVNVR